MGGPRQRRRGGPRDRAVRLRALAQHPSAPPPRRGGGRSRRDRTRDRCRGILPGGCTWEGRPGGNRVTSSSIGRASALLASGTVVSRVLGFVKAIVIADAI